MKKGKEHHFCFDWVFYVKFWLNEKNKAMRVVPPTPRVLESIRPRQKIDLSWRKDKIQL